MPTSKLKLGPLRVPSLGTRIEANSIQPPYDHGVVMTSDHHNPEEECYYCKFFWKIVCCKIKKSKKQHFNFFPNHYNFNFILASNCKIHRLIKE